MVCDSGLLQTASKCFSNIIHRDSAPALRRAERQLVFDQLVTLTSE